MSRTRIRRARALRDLARDLSRNPVVALLGARQVGKSTLAADLAATRRTPVHRFDLESPRDRDRLREPLMALEPLRGLVVLDEVHRLPDVFPVLRVLADRKGPPARFLVLGSASPDLLRQASETLAGRIAFRSLGGFALDEVGRVSRDRLWLRGGFPRSFLASDDGASRAWRDAFVRTFLERDLPDWGIRVAPETLRRFWTMLAHYHGQIWNGAELARAFGVSEMSVRKYLDILVDTLLVRVLTPWSENLAKRQVKSPKVYVGDTGILHALLGITTAEDLVVHPKVGASWEGFALDAVVRRIGARPEECHFWGTHGGAEIDLLVVRGTRRYGYEFKRTEVPAPTRSLRVAMEDLRLKETVVVHAGPHSFPLAAGIRAVSLARIGTDLDPLP